MELARRVGEALADEARVKGICLPFLRGIVLSTSTDLASGCHVILAPTINIQRSPLGGRSFESFSEDPFLNGTIAAAYINGLQSKGVSATVKHFVANEQEFERSFLHSEVSLRKKLNSG